MEHSEEPIEVIEDRVTIALLQELQRDILSRAVRAVEERAVAEGRTAKQFSRAGEPVMRRVYEERRDAVRAVAALIEKLPPITRLEV